LPSDEDMGNSEVGHNALEAGRVFDQGAKLVDAALTSGAVWDSPVWKSLIAGRTLHLLGLLSNGGVHSNVAHLDTLIDRAAQDGVKRLRVHVLTDGRDVSPRSALDFVGPLEAKLAKWSTDGRDFRIASGAGRMIATMDRYGADWAMVERGWRCHVEGEGAPFRSATEAIKSYYDAFPTMDDQFVTPFVVVDDDGPLGRITDGDSVLLFNFRGDRAVEISQAFEETTFEAFPRRRPDVFYAGMMQYDGDTFLPRSFLVSPPSIDDTVGEYLVKAGIRTLACSETQKFGHVTYFFNGNRSGKLDDQLERYVEVPSDRRSYAERPWMKAAEITDAVIDGFGQADHVRLNYANGDMVGHTGDLAATVLAVEAVDLQVGRLIAAVRQAEGVLLVTADHGNADEMWMKDKNGKVVVNAGGSPVPKTSHTLNPVPFWAYDPTGRLALRAAVGRQGIAAVGTTILELCGVAAPADYVPGLLEPAR
ncbi:MAG: phosphoglycerate mutase (2,3-diphosphoglycerate-independent), partial [Deltaproteobacteria bacterium]|nr:phosphoglycerate mutase (2,3-diphosphoglycerate-independent) [Deltaproteobacteria bacterium]